MQDLGVKQNSATSIQVVETSLSKTTEIVTSEQADIAIITLPVTNFPAETFSMASMVPVVSVKHPLADQNPVWADVSNCCQIVVRDLGAVSQTKMPQDAGWLKAHQRITVDNFDHALRAIEQGLGVGRLPEHIIAQRNQGQLKVLRVEQANKYQVPLHLTLPKGAKTGPAARRFYDFLLAQRESGNG